MLGMSLCDLMKRKTKKDEKENTPKNVKSNNENQQNNQGKNKRKDNDSDNDKNNKKGKTSKNKQDNQNSNENNRELLKKINKSTRFLSSFYSKIAEESLNFNSTVIKVKQNCVHADRLKFFRNLDSRVRESRLNVAKLMGQAQNGDQATKTSNENKIKVIVLRLFKEYFVNLISCEQIYQKGTLKTLKDLINNFNENVWDRCKKNCEMFQMKNLIEDFNELQNREIKTFQKAKKTNLSQIIENNTKILAKIFKSYQESGSSNNQTDVNNAENKKSKTNNKNNNDKAKSSDNN
jgi:hypothetical protein